MHWIALQACAPPHEEALAPPDPTALGWWALRFSPRVVRLGPAVLVEVSASERLFGGRAALVRQLCEPKDLQVLVKWSYGATFLIAFGRLVSAPDQPGPVPCIAPDDLPVRALAAAAGHAPTLERLGCSTWGQLRALPRGGVARRFGAAVLDALDRAWGLRPETHPWLQLPERFDQALELSALVESAPALLWAARRLLERLRLWLQARRLGVLRLALVWHMDPRRGVPPQGQLCLGTAEATQDTLHLQRLLAEHLAQIDLPAPVHTLRLRSLDTAAQATHSASLLPDAPLAGEGLHPLIERLGARLGHDRVLGLQLCADHRPERQQRWVDAREAFKSIADNDRLMRTHALKDLKSAAAPPAAPPGLPAHAPWGPSWLLEPPLRLQMHRQTPSYHGTLSLLAGPQRVESGWWEPPDPQCPGAERAALRDYYLARSPQAGLLWVYRQRLPPSGGSSAPRRPGPVDAPAWPPAGPSAWYLHGLYA